MILVWCTETIEEVDEWYWCLQCSKVRNCREVHNLLNRTWTEHSEACLTASHYVLVVTEDTKSVTCECTCWNVEYTWQKFTSNLVHVRNHQEKTLWCGEGCCESTRLQWTVYGTCCATLWLHLLNAYSLTPKVLTSACWPLVYVLSHWRWWSDRIDSCYLREHVAHVSSGLVTITSDKLLFFSHFEIY